MSKVLVVIPARGGSKGIPRKNVRLLAGRPLIAYAIEAAKRARRVDRIVVTTDDEEIAAVARRYGAEVVMRPPELAGDEVTLDPVIFHAVQTVEAMGDAPAFVVTVQPTSPLIKPWRLDEAVTLLEKGFDTVISVINDTHLTWTKEADGRYVPLYAARVNRQYLPPVYRETGAILASRREVVRAESRIGERITLLELPPEEAVDIDTYFDWWLAEKSLLRRHLLLRVDGSQAIGLGHVYRALSLAGRLIDHRLTFVMDAAQPMGVELVRHYHYPVVTFEGDPLPTIAALKGDIIINDILDTQADYIRALKAMGLFVVNLEDVGEGAREAHLVINALYDSPIPLPNHLWGPTYDCLRDEFYSVPIKPFTERVERILLTFGGVDESDLTARVLRALDCVEGTFEVEVVLGLGYAYAASLERLIPTLRRRPVIHRHVRRMSELIERADLAVTSAGRTVLEVASMGVPCVVLAQNEREMRHLHARSEYGIVNLGLGRSLSPQFIAERLQQVIDDVALRRAMHERMLAVDIRGGCERMLGAIFERYRAFEEGRDEDDNHREPADR